MLVRELVRCGASPKCVRNILQCMSEVHPEQSVNTVTLYQETLHQLLTSAAQSCSTSNQGNDGSTDETDGNPASKSSHGESESVKKILTAIADHETGG